MYRFELLGIKSILKFEGLGGEYVEIIKGIYGDLGGVLLVFYRE